MTYDGFLLAAVAAELKSTIQRGRIQKIRQHNDTDLTLEIRGPGHSYLLFLSADARFSRVYLTASSQPVPQTPPNFCMLMRKYAEGAFVASVEQPGMDRILRLHLDSSEHGKMTLVLEIMGKHSNLILVDDEGKILGAAKHVGSSISRYRQVLPGRDYLPPPGGDKIDPLGVDARGFDAIWHSSFRARSSGESVPGRSAADIASVRSEAQGTDFPHTGTGNGFPGPTESAARDWLMSTFSGFGPFLADEVVARASASGEFSVDRLREEMLGIREMVLAASFEPVLITSDRGEVRMVYPMPSVQFPAANQHPRESVNEALDALFRSLVGRTILEDERTQTLTAIRRAAASRTQALKSIDRTIAEAGKAERYKQIGELLVSSMHAMEKGAKSVRLVDYFSAEMPEIDIELDEKLGPQQNAERYFKRYQKARDSVSTAEARRVRTQRELGLLESARKEAESASSPESLREMRKTLTEQDLLRREIVQERHEEEFGGFRIRRMLTPEGWEILYGENSQANDYLTQRVARPNDIWLHARSITGAHVVIRMAGHGGSVPPAVMRQAVRIAAQNSEAKHSSLVPIDHTLRKFVRKPRGSAPGFVIYRNEKTIDIDPKEA